MLLYFVLLTALLAVFAQPCAAETGLPAPELAKKADTSFLVRRYDRAIAEYGELVAANPTVGLYWSRLGSSYLADKKFAEAIPAFERAEELGGFQWNPPRMVFRGECAWALAAAHAQLGHKDEAIAWTRKSLAQGLRDIRRFQDAHFESLLSDAEYRKLVWADDVKQLPREAGLRYDIEFLMHEARRIHYAPFRSTSEAELESMAKAIEADLPKLSDEQLLVRTMALVRRLGDGHTAIRASGPPAHLPVQFFLFPNGLHIFAADASHADLVGSKVLRIGDRSADEAVAAASEIASRDNPMTIQLYAPMLLASQKILRGLNIAPANGPVPIELEDTHGKSRRIELTAVERPAKDRAWNYRVASCERPLPLSLKNRSKTYWHEALPDEKAVYAQLNGVGTDDAKTLANFCTELFAAVEQPEVETLIVDMRYNGGGNTFMNPPLIDGIIRSNKINQPGKLFVIIGRNTFSAAQNTVSDLERRTKAILVGEPTGSSPNFIGESLSIPLPYCGWELSLSDLWWQHSMAMDYRIWTPPHLYAPPTAETFRAHRDPCLEAISAYRTQAAALKK